ncbi:hypothetical protein SNEBB_000399 [Seison nebaliae]|nr:hypothetical protein SNEBB_000399 [Seison nebaliae]
MNIQVKILSGEDENDYYCHLLKINDVNIMLDCGWTRELDEKIISKYLDNINHLDYILISHGTFEHIGALPLIMKIYPNAQVYCTEPVNILSKLMFYDFIQSKCISHDFDKFNLDDIDECWSSIRTIKYLEKNTIILNRNNEMKKLEYVEFYPQLSGHSLGGSIWVIKIIPSSNIGEMIVYCVDCNTRKERHLDCCQLIANSHNHYHEVIERPLLLIMDIRRIPQRIKRRRIIDELLFETIRKTVERRGDVLICTDSCSRILELVRLLSEMWNAPDLIFKNCQLILFTSVAPSLMNYTSKFISWMGNELVKDFEMTGENPFDPPKNFTISHSHLPSRTSLSRVILTSNSDLEDGYAKSLFIQMATNKNDSVILTQQSSLKSSLNYELISQMPPMPDEQLTTLVKKNLKNIKLEHRYRELLTNERFNEWIKLQLDIMTNERHHMINRINVHLKEFSNEIERHMENHINEQNSNDNKEKYIGVKLKNTLTNQQKLPVSSNIIEVSRSTYFNEEDAKQHSYHPLNSSMFKAKMYKGVNAEQFIPIINLNERKDRDKDSNWNKTFIQNKIRYDEYGEIRDNRHLFNIHLEDDEISSKYTQVKKEIKFLKSFVDEEMYYSIENTYLLLSNRKKIDSQQKSISRSSEILRDLIDRFASFIHSIYKSFSSIYENEQRYGTMKKLLQMNVSLDKYYNLSELPTEIRSKEIVLDVECEVHFIPFEGRTDEDHRMKIIKQLKPHNLIGINGTFKDNLNFHTNCEKLSKEDPSHEFPHIITPTMNESIKIVPRRNIHRILLNDDLFDKLIFHSLPEIVTISKNKDSEGRQSNLIDVASVQGIIESVDRTNENLENDENYKDFDNQNYSLKCLNETNTILKNCAYERLDLVSENDMKIPSIRTQLNQKGFKTEFERGQLVVGEDQLISLNKDNNNQIQMEGIINPDYFNIRSNIYNDFHNISYNDRSFN